jgi:hypothetical protein
MATEDSDRDFGSVSGLAIKEDGFTLLVTVAGDSTSKRSIGNSGVLQVREDGPSASSCTSNTPMKSSQLLASSCVDGEGAIWLDGRKVATDSVASGNSLAHFPDTTSYILAYEYRATTDSPGNIAVSLVDTQQSDALGMKITESSTTHHQNVNAGAWDGEFALLTYETVDDAECKSAAECVGGSFSGTHLQVIKRTGEMVGDAMTVDNVYVAGDIVAIGNKLCWPYVDMQWEPSNPTGSLTRVISFACAGLSTRNPCQTEASSTQTKTKSRKTSTVAASSRTQPAETTTTTNTSTGESTAIADIPTRSFEPIDPTNFPIITASSSSSPVSAAPTSVFEPIDPTNSPIITTTSAATRKTSSVSSSPASVVPTTRIFEPIDPTGFPIITTTTTTTAAAEITTTAPVATDSAQSTASNGKTITVAPSRSFQFISAKTEPADGTSTATETATWAQPSSVAGSGERCGRGVKCESGNTCVKVRSRRRGVCVPDDQLQNLGGAETGRGRM